MTLFVDYLQAGTYAALDDRYSEGASLLSTGGVTWRSGVLPGDGTEFKVAAQGSPNMTVAVSPGQAICPCSGSATAAPYITTSDVSTNVTISAANATNPRKDLICLTVQDAFYAGGSNNAILQVITGTPAPSPTLPATPINSIALAEVDVAANATSITNGNIIDLRTFTTGRGGILVCLSSARPSTPYAGMTIFETDTKLVQVYDGATWQALYPGPRGLTASNYSVQTDTTAGVTNTLATVNPTLTNGRRYRITYSHIGTIVTNTAQVIVRTNQAGSEVQRLHTAAAVEAAGTQLGGSLQIFVLGTGAAVSFTITVQNASGTGAARTLAGSGITVEDIGV